MPKDTPPPTPIAVMHIEGIACLTVNWDIAHTEAAAESVLVVNNDISCTGSRGVNSTLNNDNSYQGSRGIPDRCRDTVEELLDMGECRKGWGVPDRGDSGKGWGVPDVLPIEATTGVPLDPPASPARYKVQLYSDVMFSYVKYTVSAVSEDAR